MALQTALIRNIMAAAYASAATHVALYTTVPGAAQGTEIPGVARIPTTWSAPVNGVISDAVTFAVPAGVTIRGFGLHDQLAGGNYLDGAALTEQPFATPGDYGLAFDFTQG